MLSIINWQETIDSLNSGIMAIDREGMIIVFNKAASRILGFSQEQATGKRIDQVIPNTRLLEVVKTGQIGFNQRMDLKNCVIITSRSPIMRGEEIVGAVGIFQDLTEIEALSSQLESVKEINKELEAIIESVDDGIVVADGQGIIIRVNKAYQQMTGIAAEEYVGKHAQVLVEEGYAGRCLSPMVIERRTQVTIMDVRNNRELLITGNPVFNEKGDLVRVVSACRDITELNQLKEKLAEVERMRNKYHEELEHLRSQQPFQKIITHNPEMRQKIDMAFFVARVDSTILILGETGVGKDLLARLIHRSSKRAKQPFIKINCGAIPPSLLEAELFGYEPGAFTGASREGKPGLFELANGGTLFLDEIGELPLDMQVKVLQAIQDREIIRVGGKNAIGLDIRIIAATNRDLEEMVRNKDFRQDLFYRLNVVPILLPPLRNRKEDIWPLVHDFLNKYNKRYGYQKWIHPELMRYFLNYDWPGNVRELENVIERLVVTCRDDCITSDFLLGFPPFMGQQDRSDLSSLKNILDSEEKRIIVQTYRKTKSTRKAAAMLGISQSCMVKKLKKYGISAV